MRYISTRGQAPELSFEEAMLTGLAHDGGLYVPENIPTLSHDDIAGMAGKSYEEIAFQAMRPFIGDTFTDAEFKAAERELKKALEEADPCLAKGAAGLEAAKRTSNTEGTAGPEVAGSKTNTKKNKQKAGGSNSTDCGGKLAPIAARILMKVLYAARMARFDL